MARWQIPVTIDGHEHVLVVDADTAEAARANVERDRAGADRTRRTYYPTPGGGRIDVRWGRAAIVDIGDATPE